MPFCRNCGNQLAPGQKFCNKCGVKVQNIGGTATGNSDAEKHMPINNTGNNPSGNVRQAQDVRNNNVNQFNSNAQPNPYGKFTQGGQFNSANMNNSGYNSNRGGQISGAYNNVYPNNPASYNNQNMPINRSGGNKSDKKVIYIVLASAAVLIIAVIVFGILFLSGILGGKKDENNIDNALAPGTSSASQSVTQPEQETLPENPTEAATQPPTQPTSQETESMENPDYYDQKVEVVSSGCYAELTLYEWQNGKWVSLMSANATVGKNGVGYNYGEGKSVTPKGQFDLGFCYGLSKPNTKLDFSPVQNGSIFVSDSNSRFYNCLTTKLQYTGSDAEDTYSQFARQNIYNYNIFIEHNGDGKTPNSATPGMGSVITICGYNGTPQPTLGCIDITASNMIRLLSYLDQSKNPVIIIS